MNSSQASPTPSAGSRHQRRAADLGQVLGGRAAAYGDFGIPSALLARELLVRGDDLGPQGVREGLGQDHRPDRGSHFVEGSALVQAVDPVLDPLAQSVSGQQLSVRIGRRGNPGALAHLRSRGGRSARPGRRSSPDTADVLPPEFRERYDAPGAGHGVLRGGAVAGRNSVGHPAAGRGAQVQRSGVAGLLRPGPDPNAVHRPHLTGKRSPERCPNSTITPGSCSAGPGGPARRGRPVRTRRRPSGPRGWPSGPRAGRRRWSRSRLRPPARRRSRHSGLRAA